MIRRDGTRTLHAAIAAVGLCLSLDAPDGLAETASVPLSELGIERWTPAVGLAGSRVSDIVEDRVGFIWVATSGGLSRFDGHGFRNYSALTERDLPASATRALAVGSDGRLWVGLEHGGVRVLEDDGLQTSAEVAGLPDSPVSSLAEDSAGTLWIATEKGLWRSGRGGASAVPLPGGGDAGEVRQVRVAEDGAVWVRTREHGLFRIARGRVERVPDAPGCIGLAIALGAEDRVVTSCVEGIWERRPGGAGWSLVAPSRSIGRVFVDGSRALWYETDRALARREGDGRTETLGVDEGLGDERIHAYLEDSRGDVWLGTYSGGLLRLRRGAVRSVLGREGIPRGESTAVAADSRGDVWIGTSRHGLFRWRPKEGTVRRFAERDGLPSDTVWAVAPEAGGGRIWIGTERGLALVEGETIRRINRPGGRSVQPVTVLFVDPASPGTLWVAGREGGADEIGPSGTTRHDGANGLDCGRVRVFHRVRSGSLLAAGDRGVFRQEGGRWGPLPLGRGAAQVVRAIAEEPDGTLWFVTSAAGLARLRGGRAALYGEREGLPFNSAFSLELDGDGGLWLSGDEGLVRLRIDDVDRWMRREIESVPAVLLAERDGLKDRECNGWGSPASTRLPGGTLVYPTMDGIAVVDPGRLPKPSLAPEELFIDRALTGSRRLPAGATIRLAADERDLRLGFGGIEFDQPEAVRFRYRLEGLNRDWIPAGDSREAAYARVPPGRYVFRLQARLPGQEWVEARSLPRVVVEPTLAESLRLRTFAVLLLVGSVAAVVFWRFRVQARHAGEIARSREELSRLASALLKAQEEERARLARELHDDITQRLAGLAMLAGGYARSAEQRAPRDLPERLGALGHELEKLARDSQSISRELHPSLLERVGLDGALRAECATFGERSGLAIAYESRDVPGDLAPEDGIVLYRIAQEALRNVVSHSGSSEARVTLAGCPEGVELTVEDAGSGFDPDQRAAGGGLGLASMAERARLVGAELTISSRPGAGTAIRVRAGQASQTAIPPTRG